MLKDKSNPNAMKQWHIIDEILNERKIENHH